MKNKFLRGKDKMYAHSALARRIRGYVREILHRPESSKSAKTAAGLALSQRHIRGRHENKVDQGLGI